MKATISTWSRPGRGFDDTLSQVVHSRHAYTVTDVKWRHHLEDTFSVDDDGQAQLDFSKFDDVTADP